MALDFPRKGIGLHVELEHAKPVDYRRLQLDSSQQMYHKRADVASRSR